MTSELTENIQYMKLLHELKATYPIVPDEFVKECISKHGADRNHCVDVLAKESDRLRTGSLNRRFSLQALLSHQMEQRLKLEQELRQRAEVLERVKGEVEELEYKLRQKEMIEHANHRSMVHSDYLPPSLLTSKPSYKESLRDIQNDVNNLQVICDKMAAEVTKLTKDKVPLGETSIEFYESLKNFGHSDTAPSSTGSNTNANVPDNGANAEGPQWSCSECTFLNHPALDHCEECEMPRIAIGRKPYVRQASKPCFCHETTTKSSKPSLSSISSSSSSKPQKSDGPESPKADSTTAEPPSLPHIEP